MFVGGGEGNFATDWQLGDFGEKFRKAREKKGISLEDVSNVTKISVRNLQAIEEQNFDQMPGGVFTKGFIRAYAKHVGLNEEEAVTEYLACLRQEQIEARAAEASTQTGPSVDRRHATEDRRRAERRVAQPQPAPAPLGAAPTGELAELQLPRAEDARPPRPLYGQRREGRAPWQLLGAALLVVVLGVVLWQRHARGAHAQEGSPPSPAAVQRSQPMAGAPTPASVPGAAGQTSNSATLKNPVVPASGQSGKNASAVIPPEKQASDANSNDAQNRIAVPAAQVAIAAKPAATLTLVIRATENSWVSVTADGQVVSQETLIAPAHTSVHASREIVAKIGNAAGVSFLWNGQEIVPEGGESEVKTFVFDAAGMRVLPAQAPANRQNGIP